MTAETYKETLGFQTEVRQLLDLMIHSLYSNKEIFLRELISNGSDAADKLRFEAITDEALYEGVSSLEIKVSFDKTARTLTVSDNGIGMSRAEVVDNIGTIAKSGTREFLAKLSGDGSRDAKLIGQFGVGFYSAFIVADRVTLITRRAGVPSEQGVRWESDGQGQYTIESTEKNSRGTDVILHLRDGEDEFLDAYRLQNIIRKYSDHIPIPIVMNFEDKKEETINRASAFWARPRKDISNEEYDEFYKHVSHDFETPLAHVHSHVEGKLEYILLLYVPRSAPFDLWDRDMRHGIKLYVRRVFIMEDAEQLLPRYLRFIRGVMDSNDLPLNISREILQHNKDIDAIRAGAVKKVLDLLSELGADDPDKYSTFWKEFGRVFKEGVIEDAGNREQIANLLRFASTHSDEEPQVVSLADYVSRMKPGQDKIYYITADSFLAAKNSPHLEIFRKKGIEVLLLYDRVDEWVAMHLTEHQGKPLVSVAKGDLDLGGLEDKDEQNKNADAKAEYQELAGRIKDKLKERVQDVRISHRLTNSPACLVVDAHDMSANMGRLLKAAGQSVPAGKSTLEINPEHPIVKHLITENDEQRFGDWSHILFDQAHLSEGGQLEDPAGFVHRLNGLLLVLAEK
jgi:molecular chaperone HtpG